MLYEQPFPRKRYRVKDRRVERRAVTRQKGPLCDRLAWRRFITEKLIILFFEVDNVIYRKNRNALYVTAS